MQAPSVDLGMVFDVNLSSVRKSEEDARSVVVSTAYGLNAIPDWRTLETSRFFGVGYLGEWAFVRPKRVPRQNCAGASIGCQYLTSR